MTRRIGEREMMGQHWELTENVIGCAYRVWRVLGTGFLEAVYEKALVIELRRGGLKVEAQQPIDVDYEGERVGEFVADLVVEGTRIVELKAVREIATAYEVQLVNYLVATGMPVGLLRNFGETGVRIRRRVRRLPAKPTASAAAVLAATSTDPQSADLPAAADSVQGL